MALTDSLDAATQQVLALLAQLKLSNCRIIQAQDIGAADAVTINPSPAVSAYGPDLLLLVDIAHPNATTTPILTIEGLLPLQILSADGTAARIGAVAGKALFGFSSAQGGGYTARLLFSVPVTNYAETSFWHIGTAAGGSANALTTTLTPVPTTVGAGLNIRVPITATNTAAATISFLDAAGTLHTFPIVDNKSGVALTGGQLVGAVGYVADLELDTTSARLMDPVPAAAASLPTAAKAWVNFDGTTPVPTILASYNVSSVTRLSGIGHFQVNFAQQFSNANYSSVITTSDASGYGCYAFIDTLTPLPPTDGNITFYTANSSAGDVNCPFNSLVVFGNP